MGLRSAASPLFFKRIDQAVRGLRISTEDCGTELRIELPHSSIPVRSPALCEAEGGPCAACYQGDPEGPRMVPGDDLGAPTIKAFLVARLAYLARIKRVTSGEFQVRWPSFHLGMTTDRPLLRTVDLPGGLAYLADLLEARTPQPEAILSEMDGTVSLGEPGGKKRRVRVESSYTYQGETYPLEQTYLIPAEQALWVADGDTVRAGDALSEGQPSPHAILRILGEIELIRWMLGEMRDIFAAVDVRWSDRHGALLLWKMLRRIRICEAGDTELKPGELIDRHEFYRVNQRAFETNQIPAIAEAALRGLSQL